MNTLTDVPAPAKLNLFLHVVGRRDDGYHLLQSLFVLLDWADTLHFEKRGDGLLRRHDLTEALPAQDLCLKAAALLQQASGCSLGVDISIQKRLPSGAGMGGGSSDAATTLLALNRLWGLNWPRQRLQALAVQLGADVPFFVGGHNALVQGIGDQLAPLVVPALRYAVVKPPQGVATRAVFTDPTLERDADPAIVEGFLADRAAHPAPASGCAGETVDRDAFERLLEATTNHLQPVAQRHCPEVAQAAAWLVSRFGDSRMTGSGSAVFARETAGNASLMATAQPGDPLQGLPAGWVGRMCRGLEQHPLRGWAD